MPATIHVTVSRRFRGRRPGARVHHASLPASDRSTYNGVSITSVERTLIDVAAESDPSLALQAAVEAWSEVVEDQTHDCVRAPAYSASSWRARRACLRIFVTICAGTGESP